MIIYTVDLEVEAAIAAEYLAWLQRHVQEMLTLPGFLAAEIFQRIEPAPAEGRASYCVHYRLRDRDAFDQYLTTHASRMREQSLLAFGSRVRAGRGLLQSDG